MLVLSRKKNQSLCLDGGVQITVLGIQGKSVRLGIKAPDSVRILRSELSDWNDESYDIDSFWIDEEGRTLKHEVPTG